MDIGMVGLGKMGAGMATRLAKGGHRVVGSDRRPEALAALSDAGGEPAGSPAELVATLAAPRAVWLMVPAGGAVDAVVEELVSGLESGDIVIDGGNSYYKDTVRRAGELAERGIDLVDVGTSGGIWGLAEGYSMMVGGPPAAVERMRPALETLAPAPNLGWGHVGPAGAGHFVKMIHNGIEYGLMQAYAEGFALLREKRDMEFDLHQIAQIWRHGSVVRSWLLDLTAAALAEDAELADVAPYVADSGEGRWTVLEAIDLNVAAPVITHSLIERIESRDDVSYSDRLLASLRARFGGHPVRKEA